MNFCFNARPAFDKYTPKIFMDIRARYDKDALGIFVTTNKVETKLVRKTYPDAITCEVSEYLRKRWNNFNYDMFCEYEKKYDCAPLWKYIYTDRFLIHRDYNYVIKVTCGLFSFFEHIFNNYKIDVYYSETIATLQCYVAYLVGRKTGTKYFAQTSARGFDATHVYVLDDPFNRIVLMDNDYENVLYSKLEKQTAELFLNNFRREYKKPSYMQVTGKKPKFKLKFFLLPFARFLMSFRSIYNDPFSYMYYKSYKRITDPLMFYIRYKLCRHYYNKADISKKYVLFPLHYQPEASTCVCAQKYEKQLFFIDSWAKSLPADTVLYVKEHYAILGHREIAFYKELKKYPNVVLIDPWENTRELINNAQAVTTLTGTAGWEAMLLKKPVFVGGNIFFDNAPGVIKVLDIYDNYCEYLNKWQQPTDSQIIQYLCAYMRAIHPGVDWLADSDENISLIVDSLITAIKS